MIDNWSLVNNQQTEPSTNQNWNLLNQQSKDPYTIPKPEMIPQYVVPHAVSANQNNGNKTQPSKNIWEKLIPALVAGVGIIKGNPNFSASFLDKYRELENYQDQKEQAAQQQKMAAAQWQNVLDQQQYQRDIQNANMVTLTPDIIGQLPQQYQNFYQPGQKVSRDEVMGLIPTAKPSSGITPYEAEKLKIDWYNATHKGGSNTPKDPYVSQIMDMYKSEAARNGGKLTTDENGNETWTFPQGHAMPSVLDWARQNLNKNDFTRFSTGAFGSDYSLPQSISPNVQKSPVSYRSNTDFSRQDFDSTYQDVQNFGGPGAALNYYLKTKSGSPQKIAALLDRFNQAHGTQLQFTDYVKRYSKQIAAAKSPKNTQLASR